MKKHTQTFNEFVNEQYETPNFRKIEKELKQVFNEFKKIGVIRTNDKPYIMEPSDMDDDEIFITSTSFYLTYKKMGTDMPFILEVSITEDNKYFLQLWFDASPIIRGNSGTLIPAYISPKEMAGQKFINDFKKDLVKRYEEIDGEGFYQ